MKWGLSVFGDKIATCVNSWTNTFLSYAGRLQLIQSILVTIQNYWSALFVLPKAAIYGIDRTLRFFLWKGGEHKKGGAKVAWKDLCRPKIQGRLGIPNLVIWNQVCSLKHI